MFWHLTYPNSAATTNRTEKLQNFSHDCDSPCRLSSPPFSTTHIHDSKLPVKFEMYCMLNAVNRFDHVAMQMMGKIDIEYTFSERSNL